MSDPARELFLWSIFAGDLHMAEMFWKATHHPLALALIASGLARECRSFVSIDESDVEENFTRIEEVFVDYSVLMLSKGTISFECCKVHLALC